MQLDERTAAAAARREGGSVGLSKARLARVSGRPAWGLASASLGLEACVAYRREVLDAEVGRLGRVRVRVGVRVRVRVEVGVRVRV